MFQKIPNVPQSKPNILIAAPCKAIEKLDFKYYIPTIQVASLPDGLKYHADLQIHYLGEGIFVSCPETYEYYYEKLGTIGAKVIKGNTCLGGTYPLDVAYNVARVGNSAYHNSRFTDSIILNHFKENGIDLIDIKQGYAKCLTAVTGKKSLITSDGGIYNAAIKCNADALLIEEGGINLEGYNCGFIGGAAALIEKNKLFITGSLKNHPSKHKIHSFLEQQEVELYESEGTPLDIGSLITA